jgi:hypothetical protein
MLPMENMPDSPVPPPAKPTSAGQTVTWFDTGDGGFMNFGGLIGVVQFDEAVTLVVKRAPLNTGDSGLVTISSEVIPANTAGEVSVPFVGARTRVELVVSGLPDVWHVDGRLSQRKFWP